MSSIVVNMAFVWMTKCTAPLLMLVAPVCVIQQFMDYKS